MTTATTSAELETQLVNADPTKIADDPAAFGKLVRDYVAAAADDTKGLIAEQVQAGLADFYRDNGVTNGRPDLTPIAGTTLNTNPLHNRHAPGAQLDGKFESTGDLLKALFDERKGNRPAAERLGTLRNDYSTTVPSEGGFLVPEEFRAELLRIALEKAIVRPLARVIPMAAPRIKFPMIDSTSNVSSVYGGVVGYWTEEAAALVASSAKFGSITLDAQKLTGYAEIPNELLADSAVSVSAFVDQLFPEALAWFEDTAFITGNGVGQPLGFLNAAASVTVAKETSQPIGTVLWANIVKMYARMLPTSLANAVWVVNQEVIPQLLQMTLNVRNTANDNNVGGSAVGVQYDMGAGTPQMTLLGRPVIVSEKVPAAGSAGDINFVDLGYYLIGDRQSMTAMTSEHFRFNVDSTAYRIIERLDGRPWLQSSITPQKGANPLSPFVKLADRTS